MRLVARVQRTYKKWVQQGEIKKVMSFVVKGQLVSLILFGLFSALEFYFYREGKQGKARQLRRVEGVDKIDEAIGRATEMGRPVFTITGLDSFFSSNTPAVVVNLNVISYVSRKASEMGTPLILGVGPSDVLPVATELYKQGCAAAGKPEMFKESNVRFLTPQQWAYTAGILGIMERERPGACVFIGRIYAEALHFGVIGRRIGALTIAGNTDLGMASFFVVTCDYTLLGEEMYAAGAYVSGDPFQINAIVGQDVMKWFVSILLLIGVAAVTAGSRVMQNLFGL
jgi:hypothetical protein